MPPPCRRHIVAFTAATPPSHCGPATVTTNVRHGMAGVRSSPVPVASSLSPRVTAVTAHHTTKQQSTSSPQPSTSCPPAVHQLPPSDTPQVRDGMVGVQGHIRYPPHQAICHESPAPLVVAAQLPPSSRYIQHPASQTRDGRSAAPVCTCFIVTDTEWPSQRRMIQPAPCGPASTAPLAIPSRSPGRYSS